MLDKHTELLASEIISTSAMKEETFLKGTDDPEFNQLPFIAAVIQKRIYGLELPIKMSVEASLLLAVYSQGNPGMALLLLTDTIRTARQKGGNEIKIMDIVDTWPVEMPDIEKPIWQKRWDEQKDPVTYGNRVDTKGYWMKLINKEE